MLVKIIDIRLTSLDYKLYKLLENETEAVNLKYISSKINEFKIVEDKSYHNPCIELWHSINRINQSDEVDKIIVSPKRGYYKLGTEEEVYKLLKKLEIQWKQQCVRYSNIKKKVKRDQQGEIAWENMISYPNNDDHRDIQVFLHVAFNKDTPTLYKNNKKV